ncbi:amidohydrolase family protein [Solwaraspora sp. WMMB335]|uniref:amidohydrolase family protein n=1 Tax=Solwaraspora sp. WMMB335 TaxID=3404118 RepID=UPI003B92557B
MTVPLLIRGAYIHPGGDGEVLPDGCLLAVDGRIAYVGPSTDADRLLAALPTAERQRTLEVDGRAFLVLPGFVNAHWHDLFALRFPFNGALRPASDRADLPGFLARGGDLYTVCRIFDGFHDVVGALEPAEALAIARYSLWTQLRAGVTTIADAGSVNRPDALAEAAAGLGMRLMLGTWTTDAVCVPTEVQPQRTRDTDEVLAELEVTLKRCTGDDSGLLRGRVAPVYPITMTDELGRGLAELADRFDVPVATHVGAQRNEAEFTARHFGITPVRRLAALGLLNPRLMAIHCAFADAQERRLLREAEVHINHSPAKYGAAGESALTETRLIPELRRAGMDVSLSTDGAPLSFAGMPEAMRAAWQMHNELYADPTVVRPSDALAMATSIAARGLGWDDEIGALTPGSRADLVLIRRDDWRYTLNPRPLEVFLSIGGSADVDTVVVGGRVLIDGGRGVTADEERLRADYIEAVAEFAIRRHAADPDRVRAAVAADARVRETVRS